jgi:predicted nucleotidyltransferase
MPEKNKILKIKTGSQLYGTATPTSDTDYSGIFIADDDYYYGLLTINEVDNSVKSKNEDGKNTSEAVDDKLYELRNFARLAMQNNPNIIEHLFVDDVNIVYANDYGYELLNHAHLFPYKGAYDRFIGYAVSQKHKMVIKEKHFTELSEAFAYFQAEDPQKYLLEYRQKNLGFLTEDSQHFKIGDLNFQKHLAVKKVVEFLGQRMSKITNRYELVLKHGYDTKFGSHLIRLLLEGEELLLTSTLSFPLQYADTLLAIKRGEYEIGKLLELATQIEDRMRDAKENSLLPSTPQFDKINALVKKMTKSHLSRFDYV